MEQPQPEQKSRWSGLGKRVTGIIPYLAVVLFCLYMGGFWFTALVVLAALIMLGEWKMLTQAESNKLLKLIGYPLTVLPCASLIWLRSFTAQDEFGPAEDIGRYLVFSLIAIIAATDIGAYFTGKRFGKHKLAPVISPNKTWEGLGGGIVGAIIVTYFVFPALPFFIKCIVGSTLAILAQTGDLFESWVKRRAGVKDSGTLIPGHGGLLDRVDGYLLTAPVFALALYFLMQQ